MNKNMRTICNEITSGKNLDYNLPQFFNRLVTLYEQYATIKFTIHYYNFYEFCLENDTNNSLDDEKLINNLNDIVKASILSNFSGQNVERNIKKLDDIRNQIISKMKILTAYTDVFQIYEYILNRIEYRFHQSLHDNLEENFIKEVIQYIFDTKDNVVINDKIKEVIGQLPVRFTKSKFLELIRDSLSIYKGGDVTSLESFLYMIQTNAMLYQPEGMDTTYPNFRRLQKELEELDYKNITKEDYELYSTKIEQTADEINKKVDLYYGMQEAVNHLYVVLLTAPYAYMEGGYRVENLQGEMKFLVYPPDHDENPCKSIINDVYTYFKEDSKKAFTDETENKFEYVEGKQEYLYEEFEALEPILYDVKNDHMDMVQSLMLGQIFNCLNISQSLLGTSLFIEFDKCEDVRKVDESYLKNTQDELINQLTELFKTTSKYVTRAIMANTISKMPVFFKTTDEVMEYIQNSLDQCHDYAEKNACIDIIKSFWEN